MCIRDRSYKNHLATIRSWAKREKPKETEPAPEEQKTESEEKKASPFPMIMLLLFVIGAAGVGGYLYIKMKGVKPASKKNQPDPHADYHDEEMCIRDRYGTVLYRNVCVSCCNPL